MAATSLDAERRLNTEWLRDLLEVVNFSRGIDEILSYLVEPAHKGLGSDGVRLSLTAADSEDWLRLQAAHGVRQDLLIEQAPVGFPLIGLAVTKSRSVVISDMAAAIRRAAVETVDQQFEDRETYLEVLRPGPQSRE